MGGKEHEYDNNKPRNPENKAQSGEVAKGAEQNVPSRHAQKTATDHDPSRISKMSDVTATQTKEKTPPKVTKSPKEAPAQKSDKSTQQLSDASQKVKNKWLNEGIVDVEVIRDGREETVSYKVPSRRNTDESKQSPISESLVAGKALPVFEAVTQKLYEEYDALAEKDERQRKRVKDAVARNRQKKLQEDPEGYYEREARRKRQSRARQKKKKSA